MNKTTEIEIENTTKNPIILPAIGKFPIVRLGIRGDTNEQNSDASRVKVPADYWRKALELKAVSGMVESRDLRFSGV